MTRQPKETYGEDGNQDMPDETLPDRLPKSGADKTAKKGVTIDFPDMSPEKTAVMVLLICQVLLKHFPAEEQLKISIFDLAK
jgi:hypothetical protein